MRILIFANSDVGLYKFRKELIQELLKMGEVYISLPQGDLVQPLVDLGCKFIHSPIERRGVNPFKDLKLLMSYIKQIKQIKPDVILTYTIKPNVYGGIACRLTRTKYIANVTGLGTAIENVLSLQFCIKWV